METIQGFKGIFGRIDYGPFNPDDLHCRQGQKELFLAQCLKGGQAKKLTDWMEPD